MEKKATLIILNYASGYVYIQENPPIDIYDSEAVELYICDDLAMSLGSLSYMITENENPIEYLEQI